MSRDLRDEDVAATSSEILEDLERVASSAVPREKSTPTGAVLVNYVSPWTDGPKAAGQIAKTAAQLDQIQTAVKAAASYLRTEPFIVRVVVEEERTRKTYYFCRAAPPHEGPKLHAKLASYKSPIGRLAELEPGDSEEISIAGKRRELRVVERFRIHPTLQAGTWDAVQNAIFVEGSRRALRSLRQFLDARRIREVPPLDDLLAEIAREEAAAIAEDERKAGLRREAQRTLSLRDQALLDKFQGRIFRLPLRQRIMLSGPPGTGKTTTLIKRLAQKLEIEFWDDAERELLGNDVSAARTWVMFSPTNLLKLYLKESFAKEHVAASEERIKTWTDERRRLGRDVLGILKTPSSGRYVLERAPLLKDERSAAVWDLYCQFQTYLESELVARYSAAFQEALSLEPRPALRDVLTEMRKRAGGDAIVYERLFDLLDRQTELAKFLRVGEAREREVLADSLIVEAKGLVRDMQQALLREHPTLIDELAGRLGELVGKGAARDDDDDDDEPLPVVMSEKARVVSILDRGLRSIARATLRGSELKSSAKYFGFMAALGKRRPSDETLRRLGKVLLLQRHISFLSEGHRNLIELVPDAFQRFRRRAVQRGDFYATAMKDRVASNELSGPELDVIILTMLRATRRLTSRSDRRWRSSAPLAIVSAIEGEYRMQVLVDEATDFSAAQLACMLALSHPRFSSLFASGDLRQRMTSEGVRSLEELRVIDSDFAIEEIRIGYRQSPALVRLTQELAKMFPGPEAELTAYYEQQPGDVAPLLSEDASGPALAEWIARRIGEIEKALGALPSVAVFVSSDADVVQLAAALQPHLQVQNIVVRACLNGRDVGHDNDVRVFAAEFVKGLEFEAVFFVGVDRLSCEKPDLFLQTLYVGATRAVRYLALTCEGTLPELLDPLRPMFATKWPIA